MLIGFTTPELEREQFLFYPNPKIKSFKFFRFRISNRSSRTAVGLKDSYRFGMCRHHRLFHSGSTLVIANTCRKNFDILRK